MDDYWADKMTGKLMARLGRSQKAIDARVSRPVLRRQNTRDLLSDFTQDPQSFDGQGRARLMDYLHKTYGEAARMVAPYVDPQLEPAPEGEASGLTFGQGGMVNDPGSLR